MNFLSFCLRINIFHHAVIGFAIRISLIVWGKYQDTNFVVKYTDIDYSVYSDAAHFLWNGDSPYRRQTYRYSPILAALLTPNSFFHKSFGKVIFAIFDICVGYLIYKILKTFNVSENSCRICSALWLYNPLSAVVSTRGSSDSINAALMLLCIKLLLEDNNVLLGIVFGFTVHFRLYPCIYSLAFYSALSDFPPSVITPWTKFLIILCPNRRKVILITSALLGFAIPTALSYYFYGRHFINEAFIYHLYRNDIKHNFSPYFYFNYLMENSSVHLGNIFTLMPLVIQLLLLLIVTWTFPNKDFLPMSLLLQTYIFVTFNKVCTSQYFLWYLTFFPLVVALLQMKLSSFIGITVVWFTGQFLWLLPAYYLEFEGANTFLLLWIAGLTKFVLNTYLIYRFCKVAPLAGNNTYIKKNM